MLPTIFKSYDIRGRFPEEIDADSADRIGQALALTLHSPTVVIGHDMRLSSPILSQALADGFQRQGVQVLQLGQVGTDLLYYACHKFDTAGVMVTASHNPAEYGGLKVVKKIPQLLGLGSGLEQVAELALNNDFPTSHTPGTSTPVPSLVDEYLNYALSFFPTTVPPLTIAVDGGNGMAGLTIAPLFDRLGLKLRPLYLEPDGRFPNHEANPLLPENRRAIEELVATGGIDLGLAFDGDADRCFFLDHTGHCVPGDFITALFGQYFCQLAPGSTIIYDLRASNAVRDLVTAAGGLARPSRVGHTHIKKLMLETQARFGGEVSAHYYFQDFFCSESSVWPLLTMIQLLQHYGQSLAELTAPLYERYHLSGEINFKVRDHAAILERLSREYHQFPQEHLDGLSIITPHFHFNVRASNTEPVLRLTVEGDTPAILEQTLAELTSLIQST